MAMPSYGVTFMPQGDAVYRKDGGADTAGVTPIQEAVKVLSLRVPKVLGNNPLAPLALLTAPGGGALPAGMLEALMRQRFGPAAEIMGQPNLTPPPAQTPQAPVTPPPASVSTSPPQSAPPPVPQPVVAGTGASEPPPVGPPPVAQPFSGVASPAQMGQAVQPIPASAPVVRPSVTGAPSNPVIQAPQPAPVQPMPPMPVPMPNVRPGALPDQPAPSPMPVPEPPPVVPPMPVEPPPMESSPYGALDREVDPDWRELQRLLRLMRV
jgi:hypothetical protein